MRGGATLSLCAPFIEAAIQRRLASIVVAIAFQLFRFFLATIAKLQWTLRAALSQ
jgi:hypothetical protein